MTSDRPVTSPAPPIVQLAERVLREVELAVRRWPRYHKYAHGSTLRLQAMQVTQLAHRAWRDKDDRAARVCALNEAVDDLKISLQLGQQIKAFTSFAQFESIARVAADLGRQVGGWQRQHQQHRKGQNASAPQSPPQRAQILSRSVASQASEATR